MDINTVNILNQYHFYTQAPKALQEEIFAAALSTTLDSNSYFYKKDWQCSHIALIGSGCVRVFIVGDTGREITLYHVHPGGTCPINLMSALWNNDTPALAIVEAPLNAVLLPVEAFRRWMSEQTVVQQFVFESLGKRLSGVFTLMEEIAFQKMDQRIATFLLRQFEQSKTSPPTAQMTHMQIALELGSAREVISRTLRGFERLGAIKLERGRVIGKNHDALLKLNNSL